jgi:hypothetical protein
MTKKEITANLKQLPAAIARQAYYIEVVERKAILQYNEFIEADLKQFLDTEGEDFIYFDCCFGWRVVMEKEN